MSTEVHEISENAPSVCLWRLPENPNRLVSLRDIVDKFAVFRFLVLEHALSRTEGELDQLQKSGKGAITLSEQERASILKNLVSGMNLCKDNGFPDAAMKMTFSVREMQQQTKPMTVDSVATELRNVREQLWTDTVKQWFIRISSGLSCLVDREHPFGEQVAESFPSAQADLKEACNCLAVECATASIFHLMRASEVSLRTLATDRGVSYPDSSLSSRQVGDLLGALENKLTEMRKADWKNWPSRDVKDAQISFYHRALAEFRDFNEAWRKHMAHAHEGAFYNVPSATGIMKHLETFMQALAPKISEASVTPLFWTSV